MPPIGLALGKVDFSNLFLVLKEGDRPGPYYTIAAAQEAGAVTLNYGLFINSIVTFLIIAVALFFLVQTVNRMPQEKEAPLPLPTAKECPFYLPSFPSGLPAARIALRSFLDKGGRGYSCNSPTTGNRARSSSPWGASCIASVKSSPA